MKWKHEFGQIAGLLNRNTSLSANIRHFLKPYAVRQYASQSSVCFNNQTESIDFGEIEIETEIVFKKYNSIYSANRILSVGVEELLLYAKDDLKISKDELIINKYKKYSFLFSHAAAFAHHNSLNKNENYYYEDFASPYMTMAKKLEKRAAPEIKFIKEPVDTDQEKVTLSKDMKKDNHLLEMNLYDEQMKLDKHPSFQAMMNEVWLHAIKKQQPSKQVFLCYAWPIKNDHKEEWTQRFVTTLAKHLTNAGLQIYIDKFHCDAGYDTEKYMKKIQETDFVLLVSTRTLGAKLRLENNGVRYEHEEIMKRIVKEKSLENAHFLMPLLLNLNNYCHDAFSSKASIDACQYGYNYTLKKLLQRLYSFGEIEFNHWWYEQKLLFQMAEKKIKQNLWGDWLASTPTYVRRVAHENYVSKSLRNARESGDQLYELSLYGFDGIGKTELVRHILKYPPVYYHTRAIFDASSLFNLLQNYSKFATEICGFESQGGISNLELAKKAITWFESNPGWLIVYKNFNAAGDDASIMTQFTPKSCGHVIYTSKQALNRENWKMTPMTHTECEQLVIKILDKPLPGAEKLFKKFNSMPMWLKLALDEIRLSIEIDTAEDFLSAYQGLKIEKLLKRVSKENLSEDREKPFKLIAQNLIRLNSIDSRAKFLLSVCAFLNTERISYKLLGEIYKTIISQPVYQFESINTKSGQREILGEDVFSHLHLTAGKDYSISDAINTLDNSFISNDEEQKAINIPTVYGEYIRQYVGIDLKNYILSIFCTALHEPTNTINQNGDWLSDNELSRHYQHIIRHYDKYSLDNTGIDGVSRIFYQWFLNMAAFAMQTTDPDTSLNLAERSILMIQDIGHSEKFPDVYASHLLSAIENYLVVGGGMLDKMNDQHDKLLRNKYKSYLELAHKTYRNSTKIGEWDASGFLLQYGNYLAREGKPIESVAHLKEALNVIKHKQTEKNFDLRYLAIKSDLIPSLVEAKQYKEAIGLGITVLELMDTLRPNDHQAYLRHHRNIAENYKRLAEETLNIFYHKRSLTHRKLENEFLLRCQNHPNKAFILNHQLSLDRDIKYQEAFIAAYQFFEMLSKYIVDNLVIINILYQEYVDNPDSKNKIIDRHISTALNKANDDGSKAIGMINIANALLCDSENDKALDLLLKAQEFITPMHQNVLEDARLQLTIAKTHHQNTAYEKASDALGKTLEMYRNNIICGKSKLVQVDIKHTIDKYTNKCNEPEIFMLELDSLIKLLEETHRRLLTCHNYYDEEQAIAEFNPIIQEGHSKTGIKGLIEVLSGNAAAIKLSSAYLRFVNIDLERYVADIRVNIDEVDKTWLAQKTPSPSEEALTTVALSLNHLDKLNNNFSTIANVCSFMNNAPIPLSFLSRFITTEKEFSETMGILKNFKLIELDDENSEVIHMDLEIKSSLQILLQSRDREHNTFQIDCFSKTLAKYFAELYDSYRSPLKRSANAKEHLHSHISPLTSFWMKYRDQNKRLDKLMAETLLEMAWISHFIHTNFNLAKYDIDNIFSFFPCKEKNPDEDAMFFYARALQLKGEIYTYFDKKVARDSFEEAITICEKLPAKQVNHIFSNILNCYALVVEDGKSESILKRTRKILSQNDDESTKDLLITIQINLAAEHFRAKAYSDAYTEIKIGKDLVGENEKYIYAKSGLLNIEAQIHMKEGGDHEKAITLLQESLGIVNRSFSYDNPLRSRTLTLLGRCHLKNNPDKALPFFEESLQIDEKKFGHFSFEHINRVIDLAEVHIRLANYLAAKEHYETVYSFYSTFDSAELIEKSFSVDLKNKLISLANQINGAGKTTVSYPTHEVSDFSTNYSSGIFKHKRTENPKRPEILQKIHQAYEAANPNMILATVPTTLQAWHFASVLPSSNAELLKALYQDMSENERSKVVNNHDKQGKTALHKAVQKNCVEEAAYLLTLTAIDVAKKDNVDKTALDYAVSDEMKVLFNNHTKECTR